MLIRFFDSNIYFTTSYKSKRIFQIKKKRLIIRQYFLLFRIISTQVIIPTKTFENVYNFHSEFVCRNLPNSINHFTKSSIF